MQKWHRVLEGSSWQVLVQTLPAGKYIVTSGTRTPGPTAAGTPGSPGTPWSRSRGTPGRPEAGAAWTSRTGTPGAETPG